MEFGSCIGIEACANTESGWIGGHSCVGQVACKYSIVGHDSCSGDSICENTNAPIVASCHAANGDTYANTASPQPADVCQAILLPDAEQNAENAEDVWFPYVKEDCLELTATNTV